MTQQPICDYLTGKSKSCCLKVLKKHFLLQEGFKSITELPNQRIGTSFSDIWDMINQIGMTLFNLVYLRKYDRATEEKADCGIPNVSKKRLVFQEELQSITELLLNQVIATSLSVIRDMVNLKQGENIITNKEVKLLLVEFLSDKIQVCKSYQAKQSLIVFSSNLSV